MSILVIKVNVPNSEHKEISKWHSKRVSRKRLTLQNNVYPSERLFTFPAVKHCGRYQTQRVYSYKAYVTVAFK